MTDIAQSILKAIAEKNYPASAQLLDEVLREKCIPELVKGFEKSDEATTLLTLELRDHVFSHLELWDLYFAVQITSIDILRILDENNVTQAPQMFMIDFIRNLATKMDPRFSQFCINVNTISHGHYAILVPLILDQRIEELAKCKIRYRDSPTTLYCAGELNETYYGHKILSAFHGYRSYDIVVSEEQFSVINDSLTEAGLDVASMLVKLGLDEWDTYVRDRRRPTKRTSVANELEILHRVKSARSNIFSTNFRRQDAALNAIILAKTQLCNDVLMTIAQDPLNKMQRRAIHQLGESGNVIVLSFLADLMKTEKDDTTRTHVARAYSALVSRSQLSGITHTISPQSNTSYRVNISKINNVLNAILAKGMPTTMIDDTLNALAIQGSPAAVEILKRLLGKTQTSVRRAVIKATRSLDTDTAAPIVRAALRDDNPEIVALAENELDTRWPDVVWD
ncbi:MAG: HEAT repeat domain-containing protein [Candidatus Thorarchaeota archaeon]